MHIMNIGLFYCCLTGLLLQIDCKRTRLEGLLNSRLLIPLNACYCTQCFAPGKIWFVLQPFSGLPYHIAMCPRNFNPFPSYQSFLEKLRCTL